MPFLDLDSADGLVVHYSDRRAEPDAPAGPDLLFLHGYGATGAVWEPLLPFIPHGHRVVTFDARNHGRSSTTATASIADGAADVVEIVARLGLHRPVVVGSSVGAVIATRVARRSPDVISAAVLVGGLAHAAVVNPAIATANRDLVAGYLLDLIGTARASVPGWFGPFVGPRVHEWMVEQISTLRAPDPAFVAELARYDPRPYLPSIAVPMHYVHGRLDAIPLEVVEQAAELGVDTTLTVVEDAAHMPHVELPGRFAEILAGLVGEIA